MLSCASFRRSRRAERSSSARAKSCAPPSKRIRSVSRSARNATLHASLAAPVARALLPCLLASLKACLSSESSAAFEAFRLASPVSFAVARDRDDSAAAARSSRLLPAGGTVCWIGADCHCANSDSTFWACPRAMSRSDATCAAFRLACCHWPFSLAAVSSAASLPFTAPASAALASFSCARSLARSCLCPSESTANGLDDDDRKDCWAPTLPLWCICCCVPGSCPCSCSCSCEVEDAMTATRACSVANSSSNSSFRRSIRPSLPAPPPPAPASLLLPRRKSRTVCACRASATSWASAATCTCFSRAKQRFRSPLHLRSIASTSCLASNASLPCALALAASELALNSA
mmetsp:Transcript_58671/g.115156  ORF Transcript_58671/g.115156 Transcript_58671/m.115156 type:complete len:348 (+) Transcript_58671:1016-2059(+)